VPELSTILLFLSAALVLFLLPGPVVLYTVARTISQGRRAGLVSVLAAAVGDLTQVLAATAGLAALLASSPLAYQAVRYAGAAYLVYLGVRTWLSRPALSHGPAVEARALSSIFRQGVAVAVLNPKAALFLLSFLPQFVRLERGTPALQTLTLGVLFVLLGMVMNSLWVFGASVATRLVSRPHQSGRAGAALAGGVYVALGLVSALAG
jgi:threonine/homoserine/homoserine lactone efflux protein